MREWSKAGLVALIVFVFAVSIYALRDKGREDAATTVLPAQATFVGRSECIECHDPHSSDIEFNLLPGVREGKPEPRTPTVSLPQEY